MTEHSLLIRHAVKWAETRKLTLDTEVLETVLSLRDLHDEQRPQLWPEGSAEHLMLVRWPSHGPSEVPDEPVLLGTLETFWKFLRGSGRMAAGSADPKALVKEARRAAPRMAEACADPARHGVAKNMVEFGRSIGISLEEAESMEELQARMDQVVDAWNSLPIEERRALSPGETAHQGSKPGQRATSLAQALAMRPLGQNLTPPAWEGDEDWDEEDDSPMPRKDPAVVARQVQRSPFVQHVLRLANWVGDGRAVTRTGVLRLAEARAAYADLGLRDWETKRAAALRERSEQPLMGQAVPDDDLSGIRSSADLDSLDRLWNVAISAGLIEVGPTRARQALVEQRDDVEWMLFGMLSLTTLWSSQPEWIGARRVAFAVMLMLLSQGRVSVTEVEEWWWDSDRNALGSVAKLVPVEDGEAGKHLRSMSDATVAVVLANFADTGVWRRAGDVLHQTDLGYEWALLLAYLEDSGMLDEDDEFDDDEFDEDDL